MRPKEEQWTVSSSTSNTKGTIIGLLFLFHLEDCLTTISVTQTSYPIAIGFDACFVIPSGDLKNHHYI
jgi:hypothetical protein